MDLTRVRVARRVRVGLPEDGISCYEILRLDSGISHEYETRIGVRCDHIGDRLCVDSWKAARIGCFTSGRNAIRNIARALLPVRFRNGAIAVDMQYLYLIGNKLVKVRAIIPGQSWEQTQVPGFARELAIRLAGG